MIGVLNGKGCLPPRGSFVVNFLRPQGTLLGAYCMKAKYGVVVARSESSETAYKNEAWPMESNRTAHHSGGTRLVVTIFTADSPSWRLWS